jgi:hypothetical protein
MLYRLWDWRNGGCEEQGVESNSMTSQNGRKCAQVKQRQVRKWSKECKENRKDGEPTFGLGGQE